MVNFFQRNCAEKHLSKERVLIRTPRTARTYRTVRIVRGLKFEITQIDLEWLSSRVTKIRFQMLVAEILLE